MNEYSVTINDLSVTVDKVGGGTPGKLYQGEWEVTVTDNNGAAIYEREILTTGTRKTHELVAILAEEFAQEHRAHAIIDAYNRAHSA